MFAGRATLLVLLAFAVAACARGGPPQTTGVPSAVMPVPGGEWATIAQAPMAEVQVERALYEKPGAPHFFVHVRVLDRAPVSLGVDLRGYFDVFYPNQWGASDTPHRLGSDEVRMPVPPLDAATRAKLLSDHRAGLLSPLPPHAVLDFYRDFNASARSDVDAQSRKHPYVILAMDGRLDVTDGTDVTRLSFAPGDETTREVALPVPVRWERVPEGAIVLADR